MSIVRKIKRAVRGEVAVKTAALEVLRRGGVAIARNRERANLEQLIRTTPRLRGRFATMTARQLLDYFRNRSAPLVPGFSDSSAGRLQRSLFPAQTNVLLLAAEAIVNEHRWPLLGLGERSFGKEINWHLDPLSGVEWSMEYHSTITLMRGDGSDVRLLWELNRLPHLLTLARAFAVTNDERFSAEFFEQVSRWREHNPYGYGVNWACAMEVALRAINLLAAFEVFRKSEALTEQRLTEMLALFDQHGAFIRQNLEYSYVVTSNHYLSDVVGLVWLGTMLPELAAAQEWLHFGVREMLREMDKQVLPDGADFEASTGYHRFVTELFLYTFVLCRVNGVRVPESHAVKLRGMIDYIRGYLRPDGYAPLIGDSDNGQVLPISNRSAQDHAYVAAVGAVVFEDCDLMPHGQSMPEEVLWTCGEEGVAAFQRLSKSVPELCSRAFPDAGTYVMRDKDLYLLFNASGAGINGRGSHGHNDALSLEVGAFGAAFIVDPGTYVYTADLDERQLFRSTAYHSTIEVDGTEQNTTEIDQPFVIGNEAQPSVLEWTTSAELDRVSAEHKGYTRLSSPVTHRRTVTFNKTDRWWLIEDELSGAGTHVVAARFHFGSTIEVAVMQNATTRAYDSLTGASLLVCALDLETSPELESQFTSSGYGSKAPSTGACWKLNAEMPCKLRWALVPVGPSEDMGERLSRIEDRFRS